jgi:hypothetical protein
MTDIDYRWWAVFVGSLGAGIAFVLYGDDVVRATGLTLLGTALGAGATAKIGPTR